MTYNHLKDRCCHLLISSGEKRVVSSEYLEYLEEEDPTELFVGLPVWLLREYPYGPEWVTIMKVSHPIKATVVVRNEMGGMFSVSVQQLTIDNKESSDIPSISKHDLRKWRVVTRASQSSIKYYIGMRHLIKTHSILLYYMTII